MKREEKICDRCKNVIELKEEGRLIIKNEKRKKSLFSRFSLEHSAYFNFYEEEIDLCEKCAEDFKKFLTDYKDERKK